MKITRAIIIEGREASGLVLNCNNAILDGRKGKPNYRRDMIVIRSRKMPSGWSRPERVTIRNCRIFGSIRIYGMGPNGEADAVRRSSHRAGHTKRAQMAAPATITLEKLDITAQGRIPLYVSPGVTDVVLMNSRLRGKSSSTAIYLDAESADNQIINNKIAVRTRREVIAIDGSAGNLISGNWFSGLGRGGIYLYRNCGEGGTVRHQAPQYNGIMKNKFYYRKFRGVRFSFKALLLDGGRAPSIWLGSRQGRRPYCQLDSGYAFGSSISDLDHAINNTVAHNIFAKIPLSAAIIESDSPNRIYDNHTVKRLPRN